MRALVCLDSVRSSRELHCDLVMDADLGLSGPTEVFKRAALRDLVMDAGLGLLVMDAGLGLSGPSEVSQSAVPGGVAKEADSGLSRFGEVFKKPVSLFSE